MQHNFNSILKLLHVSFYPMRHVLYKIALCIVIILASKLRVHQNSIYESIQEEGESKDKILHEINVFAYN